MSAGKIGLGFGLFKSILDKCLLYKYYMQGTMLGDGQNIEM